MERPDESESSAVIEYDAIFASVPDRFAEYVAGCLSEAVNAGALVAWFAFEGSFHFDNLLTPEICSQVYGVGDRAGIALVTAADQLASVGWAQRVAVAREHLPQTDRLDGAR